jgi:hypothetical protein
MCKTPTYVHLTLTTVYGRTGEEVLSHPEGESQMVWSEEGDDETSSAHFECGGCSFEIDGDDWRKLEDTGEVPLIPFWISRGVPLACAVTAAMDGVDPDGYSLDAQRTMECLEDQVADLEGQLSRLSPDLTVFRIEYVGNHIGIWEQSWHATRESAMEEINRMVDDGYCLVGLDGGTGEYLELTGPVEVAVELSAEGVLRLLQCYAGSPPR